MIFHYKSINNDQICLKSKILVSAYTFLKKIYQNIEIHWAIIIFSFDFFFLSRFCVKSLVIEDLNLHRNGKKIKDYWVKLMAISWAFFLNGQKVMSMFRLLVNYF